MQGVTGGAGTLASAGDDPLTNFPRASPVLAVLGTTCWDSGKSGADSRDPHPVGSPVLLYRISIRSHLFNLAVVNFSRPPTRRDVLPSSDRWLLLPLLPLLITACLCHPSDLSFYGVVQTTYVCLLPPLQNRLDVLRRCFCVLTPKSAPKPADFTHPQPQRASHPIRLASPTNHRALRSILTNPPCLPPQTSSTTPAAAAVALRNSPLEPQQWRPTRRRQLPRRL